MTTMTVEKLMEEVAPSVREHLEEELEYQHDHYKDKAGYWHLRTHVYGQPLNEERTHVTVPRETWEKLITKKNMQKRELRRLNERITYQVGMLEASRANTRMHKHLNKSQRRILEMLLGHEVKNSRKR